MLRKTCRDLALLNLLVLSLDIFTATKSSKVSSKGRDVIMIPVALQKAVVALIYKVGNIAASFVASLRLSTHSTVIKMRFIH